MTDFWYFLYRVEKLYKNKYKNQKSLRVFPVDGEGRTCYFLLIGESIFLKGWCAR